MWLMVQMNEARGADLQGGVCCLLDIRVHGLLDGSVRRVREKPNP